MTKTKKPRKPKASKKQTICLNMIVRNEAHIIHELVAIVAPYIDYWVIVDTGSDDGTQSLLPELMRKAGIPGELHERPWKDFGHNRSEALALAQGHGDYIWVMDADDTIVGDLNFGTLEADCYCMRIKDGVLYWRRQLFRSGVAFQYVGVLHEHATCDSPFSETRLEGDYFVHSRRLGGRNLDPLKYQKDVEVLQAEVDRDPNDSRSVFYLAQSHVCAGNLEEGRRWYARRAEMGGWEEEIYYSLLCVARLMQKLEEPWPLVQEAYLKAWCSRPCRAEALHAIALYHRQAGNYLLGHLFAERAAQIPLPDTDILFVSSDIYDWRALDEQAICASWIGRATECFSICRALLLRPDLPEDDRQRLASNRDLAVPLLLQETALPPVVLPAPRPSERPITLTLTLIAGPDRTSCERTLNSFLHCCSDHERVDRFLVLDAGLSDADRFLLLERYRFLEFRPCPQAATPEALRIAIRRELGGQLWLDLEAGWQFFASEALLGRLIAVLAAEPELLQVVINDDDAAALTGRSAPENEIRRAIGTGRYRLRQTPAQGPALVALQRFDTALSHGSLGGAGSASLDEVLCLKTT